MNKKTQFDAIVIGAGLGGLTAAARLAKKGRKVLVLEQHYIPGGCATTYKRKDFLMEVGLHEMDGLDPKDTKTKLFEELEVFENIELIKVPEFYRVLDEGENGKLDFILPDNIEEAKKLLSLKFPKEKRGIVKFYDFITGMRSNLIRYMDLKEWQKKLIFPVFPILFPYLAMASNPFLTIISHTNPLFWLIRGWKFAFWRYYDLGTYLDAIIKDEELKLILITNLGYYHDDPYSMNLIFFSAAQGSYMEGGGWYIKGGSQKLSDYLAGYIKKHGGEVLLGKRVTAIISQDETATGVKFQNASDKNAPIDEVYSNVVIANAAIPSLIDMLSGKSKTTLQKKIKGLKPACSLLSVHLGFKTNISKKYNNKAYSTFIFQDINNLKDFSKVNSESFQFDTQGFVFVDYSKIDSGLTTDDKTVGAFCTIDRLSNWENLSEEAYKAKKEKVAQAFISRLEKVIPGISDDIECYEVATPRTIQSYTLNSFGTPYGYAQIPKQAGIMRPGFKSPVKNLYFSSAWTFPGGGFTGAIIAGQGCSESILGRHDKCENLILPSIKDSQTAKLIGRKEVAKNTFELVFEKPQDFNHFLPGQYAIIALDQPKFTELDMALRPMSIVSHPSEKVLRFAMRESKSAFKQSCRSMQPGDTAKLYGPKGDFTLKSNDRGLVFLISGIGITPVISMLKELEVNKSEKKIILIYSNRHQESTAYDTDLKNIALKNFKYVNRLTSVEGRVDNEFIKKQVEDFDAFDYYMVGTTPFLINIKKGLLSEGVNPKQIHMDDFG